MAHPLVPAIQSRDSNTWRTQLCSNGLLQSVSFRTKIPIGTTSAAHSGRRSDHGLNLLRYMNIQDVPSESSSNLSMTRPHQADNLTQRGELWSIMAMYANIQ